MTGCYNFALFSGNPENQLVLAALQEGLEIFFADSLEIMSPDVREFYKGMTRNLRLKTTVPDVEI